MALLLVQDSCGTFFQCSVTSMRDNRWEQFAWAAVPENREVPEGGDRNGLADGKSAALQI